MTLAHRAVGDIRRGGFRQLRNYVDMCSSLAKRPQQKDFFAYAQKALQRTDSCYYSLVHNLLDTVDEDRLCTVGVNMGFGGLIYGASEMKKQADVDGKPFSWITAAHCGDPALPALVAAAEKKGSFVWVLDARIRLHQHTASTKRSPFNWYIRSSDILYIATTLATHTDTGQIDHIARCRIARSTQNGTRYDCKRRRCSYCT